jgi:hypothetical protein
MSGHQILSVRQSAHVPKDETGGQGQPGMGVHKKQERRPGGRRTSRKYFPKTSRAGITRIGCEGFLSASLQRLPAHEAPLFRPDH